jgi:hypothetical protein
MTWRVSGGLLVMLGLAGCQVRQIGQAPKPSTPKPAFLEVHVAADPKPGYTVAVPARMVPENERFASYIRVTNGEFRSTYGESIAIKYRANVPEKVMNAFMASRDAMLTKDEEDLKQRARKTTIVSEYPKASETVLQLTLRRGTDLVDVVYRAKSTLFDASRDCNLIVSTIRKVRGRRQSPFVGPLSDFGGPPGEK